MGSTTTTTTNNTRVWWMLLIVVVLLLGWSATTANAQKCAEFKHKILKYCDPYIDYKFFLPAGPTEWIIEALMYNAIHKATLQATLTPRECQRNLIPYICSAAFQKCTKIDGEAVAKPVCKSQCDALVKPCVATLGVATPNCTSLPKRKGEVTLSTGKKEKVSCFDVPNNVSAPPFPFKCSDSGVMNYDKSGTPFPCAIACPVPLYSDEFIDAIDWFTRIMIPISFSILLIFFMVQLYQYDYWLVFPRIFIWENTLAILIVNLAWLVAVCTGSMENLGCANDTTTYAGYTVYSGVCKLSNWLLYFGSWMAQIIFAIIATNVMLALVAQEFVTDRKKIFIVLYHILIYVPPTVILIVAESTDMTGYGTGLTPCLFKQVAMGAINDAISLFCFLVPFTITQVYGIVCLTIAFVLVFKRGGSRALKNQLRLMIFLIFYGTALVCSLVLTWNGFFIDSDDTVAYFTCRIQNWVATLIPSGTDPIQEHCDWGNGRPSAVFFFYSGALVPVVFSMLKVIFFLRDVYVNAKESNSSASTRARSQRGSSRMSVRITHSTRSPSQKNFHFTSSASHSSSS